MQSKPAYLTSLLDNNKKLLSGNDNQQQGPVMKISTNYLNKSLSGDSSSPYIDEQKKLVQQ